MGRIGGGKDEEYDSDESDTSMHENDRLLEVIEEDEKPKAKEIRVVTEQPGSTLANLTKMLADSNSTKMLEDALTKTDDWFDDYYEKEKRLQSGSYGTVYTCQHRNSLVDRYAVKILDRKKLKRKDVDGIFREVRILHELTQTRPPEEPLHFVGLIDFFVEPDSIYIIQVFASGGDVFDRLTSRKTYTEKDARDLAKNLLQAVLYLHSHKPHKIIHRDLKPENLLLVCDKNDTQILLADFGFARHLKDGETCSTRCGTPAYCSPEILLGVPYSTSVDLWSVGCILYMLIAGYSPFQAPHHRALFRKIRAGDYVFHEQYWKNGEYRMIWQKLCMIITHEISH
jgi:serine/threonine protein kinase